MYYVFKSKYDECLNGNFKIPLELFLITTIFIESRMNSNKRKKRKRKERNNLNLRHFKQLSLRILVSKEDESMHSFRLQIVALEFGLSKQSAGS